MTVARATTTNQTHTMSASMLVSDDSTKVVQVYNPDLNKSTQLMTKYEFNQIIGLRTMHLSRGAPIFLNKKPDDIRISSNMELRKIATEELLEGKLPYIVKRVMPNGKPEYWKVNDLDLTAIRHLMRGQEMKVGEMDLHKL